MTSQRAANFHYILFYKPFGVVSQFTPEGGHSSLAEFGPFPATVYPVGRLDADSEGLLLLTDDNEVKHRLLSPRFGHPRTYLVQVEGVPEPDALEKLRSGILLDGKKTLPAQARLLLETPSIPPRSTPIRYRKSIPTSWIELELSEGRNRQVRKMTAAVGYPTLRLIRTRILFLTTGELEPGMMRDLSQKEVVRLREVLKAGARRGNTPVTRPDAGVKGASARRGFRRYHDKR